MKLALAIYSFWALIPSLTYGVLTFPERKILEKRLNDKGFEHLHERTQLLDNLANKTETSLDVYNQVGHALREYEEYLKLSSFTQRLVIATMISMRSKQDELLATLLQDSPEALAELAQKGLYKAQAQK